MKVQRSPIQSLEFENLSFGFEDRPVLENLNLTVPAAPFVCVQAPSGGGKSTLLKILAGLLMPTEGRYLLNGESVGDMSLPEFLKYRLSIGYSFDSGGLLSNRSLFENLLLPLKYHRLVNEDEAKERTLRWMKRFRLDRVRDRRPSAVTGHERKQTILLRSLIHHPQLVLLDDPTTGMKEWSLKEFFNLVRDLRAAGIVKQVIFASENPWMIREWNPEFLVLPAPETMSPEEAAA